MTFADINALSVPGFVAALGPLFEHSPWVAAEAAGRRPFRDPEHLHAELCAAMRRAPRERRLALIRAHPDLAGRLARSGGLTAASAGEQSAAGLDRLTAGEAEEFQALNAAYRERFGFPFVICARLSDRTAIREAMKRRLANPEDVEFETALAEIEKIAALRLRDLLEGASAA